MTQHRIKDLIDGEVRLKKELLRKEKKVLKLRKKNELVSNRNKINCPGKRDQRSNN